MSKIERWGNVFQVLRVRKKNKNKMKNKKWKMEEKRKIKRLRKYSGEIWVEWWKKLMEKEELRKNIESFIKN